VTTSCDRREERLQKRGTEESQSFSSDTVLDRFRSPKNLGRLANPDARGIVHGWCGDTMEIFLRLERDVIREVRFMTNGCGPTVACGSMLASMAEGIPVTEARKITPERLIVALGGLPEQNEHCAKLAVDTLLEAIRSLSDEQSGA
jgi:nitrogen fixation NifU-like protein